MWTVNFLMFKLVLEKAKEPEIKLPTSDGSSKKQESFRKTSISASLTIPKPLTVWITINYGKFWKRWEHLTCLLRNLYAGQKATVRTGHGTTDGFQIGKGCILSPWHTPFPIWNQSVVPCPVLTVAFWPAYRFLKRRSGGLVFPSLSEFSTVCRDPHGQRLWHSQ